MAIAHSYEVLGAANAVAGNYTIAASPPATPAGVVVIIVQSGLATDLVTGVTYGGVSLARMRFDSEGTEPGAVYLYWAGDATAFPSGAQNVVIARTGTTDMRAVVYTMTVAAGSQAAWDSDATGTSASVANPSWTHTTTAATNTVLYEGIHSGLQTMVNTPATGWTLTSFDDPGSTGKGWARRTHTGGAVTAGWIAATADDFVGSSIALKEVAGATAKSGSDTASGTDAGTMAATLTPATDASSPADAGTIGVTLTPATDPAALTAETSTLDTTLTGAETSSATESGSVQVAGTITQVGTATVVDTGAGTSIAAQTPALPTGWQAGDVGVLFGHVSATSLTLSTPTGWTAIPGVTWPVNQSTLSRTYGWYRVLQAGDTAPSSTPSGAYTGGLELQAFRGVDNTTPIGQAGSATVSAASITMPTLTGVAANSQIVASAHARVATGTIPSGITPEASYTELVDHATTRITSSANFAMETATKAAPTAGSYGGETFSVTNAISSSMVGILVELKAASTGPTSVSGSDTAAGGDVGTLATALTPATDTSTLVDAGTLLASFSGTEAGGSVDAPSGPLSAALTGADTGADVEAYQLSVVLQSADTGAQTDAGSVVAGGTNVSSSDTGTGTDAATLAVTQPTRADTGSASDVATLVVTITAPDLATMADVVLALAAAHTGADTSSQTESQTVNAGGAVSGGDTNSAVDSGTVSVTLTGADTSTHTENQSLTQGANQSGSETSSAAENRTLAVQLTASEIVTAIEGFSLSAGGNPAGTDAGAMVEQTQLLVQVTGSDGVTTIDQGSLTLFKSGADTSTVVDSASLLAQLTVAEIVAAVEVLAVLTGPQTWNFISADLRAITGTEADSGVLATEFSNSTQTTEFNSSGTQISVTVTW